MKYTLFLACAALLASSCSSIKVRQDYDTSTSFSKYTSFMLEEIIESDAGNDPLYENELNNRRFQRIIKSYLQKKGYSYQEREKADFKVSFTYTANPWVDIYNISRQMGFSYGSYSRYGGVGAKTCTDISEFDMISLIVEIRDGLTEELIWRGIGSDVISIYATPVEMNEHVEDMVTAVLKNFPPD